MKEQWARYYGRDDGAFLIVDIDLAPKDHLPNLDRPLQTILTLAIRRPDDEGVYGDAEHDAILGTIEKFMEQFSPLLGVTVPLMVQGGGTMDVFVYSKLAAQRQIEVAARKTFGDSLLEVSFDNDPTWPGYSFMYPNMAQMRMIVNIRKVGELLEAGDSLETPRQVDHFAKFPDEASAKRYAEAVMEFDFQVALRVAEGESEVLVVAMRDDPATHESIGQLFHLLSAMAEGQGGVYDGWDTQIAPKT
jgi:Regulator of ribonuclease activity B/Family of unknown function (DUF695)